MPRGEIEFKDIRFGYGRESGLIDGLSLTIQPGERIGLVGRSGAGKSTLVNLMLRFFDLEDGRILIDGQDIAKATQESLRAADLRGDAGHLAAASHDPRQHPLRQARRHRWPRSSPPPSRPQAHDFILELEDWRGRRGYDAHVGERGVKLSGGQRQRVAIARVILKNAPILVLDEATSCARQRGRGRDPGEPG